MSSRKAMYESSILCNLGADVVAVSGFPADVRAEGFVAGPIAAEGCGFGLAFGAAVSRLTRTDAGTIAVSSGLCCANGLLTTVDAADLTYDGF